MRTTCLLLVALLGCRKPTPMAPEAPTPTPRTRPAVAPLPVWIDADPSVGVEHRDVDDGLALLQALRSEELTVRGVSTVFGNAPLAQVDPVARELLAAWAPGLPVHTGAAEPSLAPTPASEALAEALDRERLTVLVLGPATNLAAVLHARPDLVPRVREVIAVAGRRPGQRFTTGTTNPRGHRDLNFEQDPAAFQVLLDAGVPLVLAPFELSSKVWLEMDFLDQLAAGADAGRLVPPARAWLGLWQERYGVQGFNPFDTLAIGHLVHPELLTCAPMLARIEQGPDDRDESTPGTVPATKPFLHLRPDGDGAPVTYCHDVQADAFVDDLRRRLLTR
jgi:pyrimidine-specific ribonucleoside hydrolase